MSGHYQHLVEKRDSILSSARVSPAARARIMGRPAYPGAIFSTPAVKPKTYGIPDETYLQARRRPLAPKISVGQVLEAVSAAFAVDIPSILGPSKFAPYCRPRFAAALLLRDKLKLSQLRVGAIFMRSSESSGAAMIKRGREMLSTDPAWAERYHAAERLLKGDGQ